MSIFSNNVKKLYNYAMQLKSAYDFAPLTDLELEIKYHCEQDLLFFAKTFYTQLFPNGEYTNNKVLECLRDILYCFRAGEINKVITNILPRIGKSYLQTGAFPAWVWTTEPNATFLCISYGKKLANDHAKIHREICQSKLYERLWGQSFRLKKNSQGIENFANTMGGARITGSIESGVTGFGADYRIIDDPNRIKDRYNSNILEKSFIWFKDEFSSRMKNYGSSRILITQQRVADKDLTGRILKSQTGWTHFYLPLEYDPKNICTLKIGKKVIKDWRKEEGESLVPHILTDEVILELKRGTSFDQSLINATLQQMPDKDDVCIIKEEWLKIWEQENQIPPSFEFILQSWDTSFTNNKKNARSACTTWAVTRNINGEPVILLLSVHYGHWLYPDLKEKVADLYENGFWENEYEFENYPLFKPDLVLIEAKASGYDLLSDLARSHPHIPLCGFNPSEYGDKETRMKFASTFFKNGLIYFRSLSDPVLNEFKDEDEFLISDAVEELKKELTEFPNSEYADLADSCSQALIWLRNSNLIYSTTDRTFSIYDMNRGGKLNPQVVAQYNFRNQAKVMVTPNNPIPYQALKKSKNHLYK